MRVSKISLESPSPLILSVIQDPYLALIAAGCRAPRKAGRAYERKTGMMLLI
jgi:hypothetical protein